MISLSGWIGRLPVFMSEKPKGPWGDGGSGGDDGGKGGGPRNPWALPPTGKRATKPTALDEFLKKARGAGGDNGGGFGRLPGGASPRSLWLLGVGLVVLAWIILTSFHQIAPQERGVVTFLGRYAGTLDPGVRMTLPAPLAQVTKVDVQNIRTDDFPQGTSENLMLTRDQNIVNLAFSVRWNIGNPEDFVFQIKEPQQTVRATAESSMREAVANMSLDTAIGAGRSMLASEVQQRMQRILDSYRSGIRIQGVAVKQATPPEQVNDAFKRVTAAQQDAVAARNAAQGYARQLIAGAEGEAQEFDKVYSQYKLAPEVTRRRMYYETMEEVLANTDKTIVEVPGTVPYLPLGQAKPLPNPDAGAGQ